MGDPCQKYFRPPPPDKWLHRQMKTEETQQFASVVSRLKRFTPGENPLKMYANGFRKIRLPFDELYQ